MLVEVDNDHVVCSSKPNCRLISLRLAMFREQSGKLWGLLNGLFRSPLGVIRHDQGRQPHSSHKTCWSSQDPIPRVSRHLMPSSIRSGNDNSLYRRYHTYRSVLRLEVPTSLTLHHPTNATMFVRRIRVIGRRCRTHCFHAAPRPVLT